MRTIAMWLALSVAMGFAAAGMPCAVSGEAEKVAAGAVNDFSAELFRRLAESDSGNLVVSPYSLECALAAAAYGAGGETGTQMLATLNLRPSRPGGEKAVHNCLGALSLRLGADAAVFSDATLLVHAEKIRMRDDYITGIGKIYRAAVQPMNFGNSRRAANEINAWVAKATRGHITELLDSQSLSAATVAVLLNALAFHGVWENAFSPDDTRSGPFTASRGRTTAMYMKKSLPVTVLSIAEGGNVASEWNNHPVLARMASLPFTGGEWEMVFFHPAAMGAFLGALTPESMRGWLESYDAAAAKGQGGGIAVAIPKFAFSWDDPDRNIKPALEAMGMRDAFGPSADFSGMSREGGFGISEILHEARIEVDESGATAAAATALVVTRSAARAKEFIVDSSFVFLIRHVPTGAVLMLGRVDRPDSR